MWTCTVYTILSHLSAKLVVDQLFGQNMLHYSWKSLWFMFNVYFCFYLGSLHLQCPLYSVLIAVRVLQLYKHRTVSNVLYGSFCYVVDWVSQTSQLGIVWSLELTAIPKWYNNVMFRCYYNYSNYFNSLKSLWSRYYLTGNYKFSKEIFMIHIQLNIEIVTYCTHTAVHVHVFMGT